MIDIRLKDLMNEKGIDAVIAVSPENVLYTSGVDIFTQKLVRDRLAFTVFSAKSEPTMIVCNIEEGLTREESSIQDIRTYVEFKESPISKLVEVLKEKGLTNAVIAIETEFLAMEFAKELEKDLPNIKITKAEPLFNYVRVYKSKEEVELLKYAASSTTNVIEEVFQEANIGDTEKEIAIKMNNRMIEKGGNPVYTVLGSGYRSTNLHAEPTEKKINSGEVMRTDFSGLFKGYYSDVARTVFVGTPSARQEMILTSLFDIHKKLIQSAKVGVKFSELYNYCVELFKEKNLAFSLPHIGHSIGVVLHEEPIIHPFNERKLEEGMVLNVEPLCVDEETESGYHVEDLIHITKDGPELLTCDTLREYPIIVK